MWPSMGIASIVTIEMPQNMAPVMLYRGTSNSRAKGRKCSPTIVRSSGAMSAQRRVTTHVRVAAVKATPSAAHKSPESAPDPATFGRTWLYLISDPENGTEHHDADED